MPPPSVPSPPGDAAPGVLRRRRIYRILLTILTAAFGAGLKFSQKPWEGSGARRRALGRALKFDELVEIQLWWAAAIICGLLALALVTSPWWMRWAHVGDPQAVAGVLPRRVPEVPWRRKHTWLLAGILVVALMARLPRMSRFMERDEQDTVRRSLIGYVPLDAAGNPSGAPVIHPWKLTVWECGQANNPFLFSVAARLSVRAWQALSGAEPWRVFLPALRLPPLLAGLLSLTVLAWLGFLAGRPGLGLLAGLLGAVHPLHVEFSTQARGYGMVLLFAPLALGCAWLALRTGRWRHWLAAGGSLFGLLTANPGSIYFAGALGLCLTADLLLRLRQDPARAARMALTRWILAAGLAALCYLPVILPALPQALPYLKTFKGGLHGMWVQMTWSWYAGGLCYPPMEITKPWLDGGNTPWAFFKTGYFTTEPLTACFVIVVVPLVLWTGARWWWRQEGFRPLLLASVLAPLTAYFLHRSEETPFLFHWYLIYWLPPALLLTAAGLVVAGQYRGPRPALAAVPAGIFMTVFLYLNLPGPGRLLWHNIQPDGPEIYVRGKYQWITQPDGITYRQLWPGHPQAKPAPR